MSSSNTVPRLALITSAVLMFGVAGLASAADNGKAQGKGTTSGNRYIRVIDPDGVKTVTWYNSNDRNDANRKAEGTKTFSCDPAVTDTGAISVGTGLSHPHGHDVEYEDCKGNSEEWEVKNYFTNWQNGARLTDSDDDDDGGEMEIGDLNNDGSNDIVIKANGILSVFLGSGDGRFYERVDTFMDEVPRRMDLGTFYNRDLPLKTE